MAAVLPLEQLLDARRLWRGTAAPAVVHDGLATGIDALDAALPGGGWPATSLTEVLIGADGVGELQLLWPALARLTETGNNVVLVAPPYTPHGPAWRTAGVRLSRLIVVHADRTHALWAAEQSLRAGSCGAVVCWPGTADDRALRRLQVAAETGGTAGFAIRPASTLSNPSPAPVRVAISAAAREVLVVKCRGALPPSRPIPFPRVAH